MPSPLRLRAGPAIIVALSAVSVAFHAFAVRADDSEGSRFLPVITSLGDLPYDSNDRLASHVLAYPANDEECAKRIKSRYTEQSQHRYGFVFAPVSGEASDLFFPEESAAGADDGDGSTNDLLYGCRAVCQERGVDRSLAHAALPLRRYEGGGMDAEGDKGDGNWRSFEDWFRTVCVKTEVGFMNYYSKTAPIKLLWVNNGEERDNGEIEYGERNTRCFHSYLGHTFRFRDSETNELILEHTVEFVTMRGVGPLGVGEYDRGNRDFNAEIRRTHGTEWRRHDKIKRTFSSLGFQKGRLPDDVYASMGAFYYNNAEYREKEEWSHKGVFVNWWEVDVYFVQIPWGLKKMWQDRLMELVEAWTGTKLEQTDMYGLRRYEEGARLLTHVDREATHAASLIVNIAQGNVSKPWPVEVYDHGDRLHEVPLVPGDIVYYESARCLHGRNRPLEGPGAYYVNLFTHYRPVGDPRWYQKANPEGTPEPLEDVGECRHSPTWKEDAFGVGAVECDDRRVGPYLSPTMYSAKGGDSLQNWWEMVAPSMKEDEEEMETCENEECVQEGGRASAGESDEL